MSKLLLASQFTRVSIPIVSYENSLVIYQIVCHVEGLSTDQVFVIAPLNGDKKNSEKYMFVGYSQKLKSIEQLTITQALASFDLLIDKIEKLTDGTQPLNVTELREAKERLQSISNEHPVSNDLHLELTDKVSVLINIEEDTEKFELWGVKVEFSSLIFSPIIFEFVGYKGSDDEINILMCLEDMEEFKKMHLLDDVKIHVDYGDGFQLEYSGICTSMDLVEKGIVRLHVQSMMYDLGKSKSNRMITKANPLNIIYFMLRTSGLSDDNINIEGLKKFEHVYTVIIPILKLTLNNSLGIANVTLSPSNQDTPELIKIYESLESDSYIFRDSCLATIHVESDNIFDAYTVAKKQIQQSLDVLMHLIRSDTLFQGFNTSDKVQCWSRDILTPKPELSPWFYIEDNFSGEYIVTSTDKIVEPEALILDQNYKMLDWYEMLLFKLTDHENKHMESLFSALKWLRRSWDADNAEDQIIYAIIALEFVIAGESSPPLIEHNYQEEIKKAALAAFSEIYDGNEQDKRAKVQQIKQKLSHALTEAPLLSKMRSLIERLNIPISEDDIKRIKNARTLRNDVVHGKSSESLKLIDVWKLNNAIGLITAHKLNSMKELDG